MCMMRVPASPSPCVTFHALGRLVRALCSSSSRIAMDGISDVLHRDGNHARRWVGWREKMGGRKEGRKGERKGERENSLPDRWKNSLYAS